MGDPSNLGLAATLMLIAATAGCGTPSPLAGSVGQFGAAASDRAPGTGQGYGARERHMADCLASYPGYDPRTDSIVVRPGVSQRCPL